MPCTQEWTASGSIHPEIFEPVRSQLSVAGGVLDVPVTEVMLDRAGIPSVVGQLVAGRMAQHVRVDGKPEAGGLTGPGDNLADGVSGALRSLTNT